MKFSQRIGRAISDFGRDAAGHVAVIFALSIIPILTIAGLAVDFQATTTQKVKVQSAVDAAVIAAARAVQAGKTPAEVRSYVKDYVKTLITTEGRSLSCLEPEVVLPQDSQDISVNIRCKQKTSVSQVIGQSEIVFDVSSTSTWGVGKLDVAFMFDVSGSMGSNNRMTNLKAAAQEAVETLKPKNGGVATDDVRIAMVSYNDSVNAGEYFEEVTGLSKTRTYKAIDNYVEDEWVEVTTRERDYVCDTRSVCKKFYKRGKRKGQCKSNGWRTEEYNCRWDWVETTEWKQQAVPKQREVTKTVTSTCVWERYGDEAFTDFAPVQPSAFVNEINDAEQIIYHISEDEDNSNGYLSAGYAYFDDRRSDRQDYTWIENGTNTCRSHTPLALTTNRAHLDNYIKNLTTGGGTAGHQGIAWAWYLVSDKWDEVFTGDSTPLGFDEPDSMKAVILMTDGDFLHQRFGDQGSSNSQAKAVCDAMKAQDKVIIYTVAFQAPNKGKDILKYCASGPEFAFEPSNGQELSDAYQAIATSISDLRIKY